MLTRLCTSLLLAAAMTLATGGAAGAHEGEEEIAAIDSVRQAIAYIVNTPDDMDVIVDKVADATEAEDQEGVDVALVEQARAALERDDMVDARVFLLRAIGARLDLSGTDVHPILQVPADSTTLELATGEQTGTIAAVDPLSGRGDVTGTDLVLLGIAVVLAAAGAFLALRWRPADTVRRLRRRLAGPATKGT